MDESPAEDESGPGRRANLRARAERTDGQLVEWLERGVPAHCYLDNIEKWAELALQLSWKPPPREGGVHMTDPTVATHDGLGWRRRLGSELVEVLVKHEIEQAMIARRVISAAMMIVPVSDAAELATTGIRARAETRTNGGTTPFTAMRRVMRGRLGGGDGGSSQPRHTAALGSTSYAWGVRKLVPRW